MKLKKTLLSLTAFAAMHVMADGADITIAYEADPVSMDPMEQLSSGTLQMMNMVYDPLMRYDSDLKIEPRLAESWEEISPTVLRFHLRKGVRFHNGHAMTADDVIFSLDRMKQSRDFKALYEPYVGMKKVDEYMVDLIMKKPYPLTLALANMTYLPVMDHEYFSGKDKDGRDKALVEKNTATFAATHENGTGAFVLDSRQQGVKSLYRKYARYWDRETGNVDSITLVPIAEDVTRVSALFSGDVDWIYPIPTTDIERVEKSSELAVHYVPSDKIITFQMNQQVVPEFRDKRVRQAVVYAVNNAAIAKKVMRGKASVAAQNSPPGFSGYNATLKPRYDLEKARRLMREAGFEKGFKVTMIAPNNRYVNDEKIAQAVAAMLAKINIKVNLTTMPKVQYWGEYDKCTAGMAMLGWSSDTGDSANYSEFLTMTKNAKTGTGAYNCGGFSNRELDRLVTKANGETDPEKRNAILRQVSALEYDEALFVPLHWQNMYWGFSKRFRNFPKAVYYKNFPHWDVLIVD